VHGNYQLLRAIAAKRAECFTGQTLRVQAQQWSFYREIAQITENDREGGCDSLIAIRRLALEANHLKHAPPGRHLRCDGASNCSTLRAVACDLHVLFHDRSGRFHY
jgi:hypothetical protein